MIHIVTSNLTDLNNKSTVELSNCIIEKQGRLVVINFNGTSFTNTNGTCDVNIPEGYRPSEVKRCVCRYDNNTSGIRYLGTLSAYPEGHITATYIPTYGTNQISGGTDGIVYGSLTYMV